MKKMKKLLVLMTCAFVLFGTAACSSRDNADNGADQSATENSATDNDRTDNNTDTNDRTMNDATEGDGILDDAVHDVTDGVDGAAFPIHPGSVEQGGRGPVFHNAPPVFLWSSIPRTLPQPPRFDESGSLNRNGPVPAGKRRCPVRGVAGLSCGEHRCR